MQLHTRMRTCSLIRGYAYATVYANRVGEHVHTMMVNTGLIDELVQDIIGDRTIQDRIN